MTVKTPLLICLIALTPFTTTVHAADGTLFAGSAAEREALARLANEIKALKPLIAEAKRVSPQPSGRFRFEYTALQRDLDLIDDGIQAWLFQPDTTPREIAPLSGDYLR